MDNGILFAPQGATPIEPDDLVDLIPSLHTSGELNAFEQINIAQARLWARRSRTLKQNLLNMESLKLLHQKMFNETWEWAGQLRTRETNIGVAPYQISTQLTNLCSDAKVWIEHKLYSSQVFAIRFHHKLVSVHPFKNGNGRHARLVADLLMIYGAQPPLKWGGKSLDVEGETRTKYLDALVKADSGNYEELIHFALSE